MNFVNFTIVKFSVFLVLGILTSHFFPVAILTLHILLALFGSVIIAWFWARKQLFQKVYFGVATYLCLFFVGYFNYQIRLPQFQPKHYLHVITENSHELVQLKIIQNIKPDPFNLNYFAQVKAINGKKTNGNILLNISRDS